MRRAGAYKGASYHFCVFSGAKGQKYEILPWCNEHVARRRVENLPVGIWRIAVMVAELIANQSGRNAV